MLERIQECEENGPGCDFPLSWSISPHLLYLAPDWLHWYYQLANQTGHDVFVLPPSGHLYAYPGKLLKSKAKLSAIQIVILTKILEEFCKNSDSILKEFRENSKRIPIEFYKNST